LFFRTLNFCNFALLASPSVSAYTQLLNTLLHFITNSIGGIGRCKVRQSVRIGLSSTLHARTYDYARADPPAPPLH
jgi:hypothetical protein